MKKFLRAVALTLSAVVLLQGVKPIEVQAKTIKTATEVRVSNYQIRVNRVANCVTVYTYDSTGNYTVPVRSFACSVGKNINNTPLGTFKTSDYYDWRLMVDGSYGQYAIRFNRGILFHSVPYLSDTPDSLETDQFNLLGTNASLGCVRLATSDVKWLYENCPQGTEVIVYDDALNPGPLGKPVQMKTIEGISISGWDPTDDRAENPWNTLKPSMYLRLDFDDDVLYMFQGSKVEELKDYVGCRDYLGNDLLPNDYQVTMNGNYDLDTVGVYKVWVSVFDGNGIKTEKEVILAVVPAVQK